MRKSPRKPLWLYCRQRLCCWPTGSRPRPDRASLIKGLESLKDYDNGITDRITFGPEDHQGVTASYI